jgi:hypothetical protein
MKTAPIQILPCCLCLVLLGCGGSGGNAACADCLIAGVCYPAGVTNPANSCLVCDPERDAAGWSDDDGQACDDGRFCTVQDTCFGGECGGAARACSDGIACNGVETCDEAAGACAPGQPTCQSPEVCDATTGSCVTTCTGCVIGAVCYGQGQPNPLNACEQCDAAVSATGWSNADGQACDDGVFCNGADTCSDGTCSVSAGDPCGDDGIFCNGVESCDEGTRSCVHSGDPCTGDTLCLEASNQCCLPNVAATTPVCDANGDVVATDSCGRVFVVENCADVNGTCQDGVCGCAPHVEGANCDRCAPGWTGAACDTCVVYVNGATGSDFLRDGSTWVTALKTVQVGLQGATLRGGCEVWVAAGTYVPGTTRDATFQLAAGVSLYGGFAGNEVTRGARNIAYNKTILSGDIGTPGVNTDNVYHVVTGATGAVIDGFTITGGMANGAVLADSGGAGMTNVNASPTVANCTFTANTAAYFGGGMHNSGSSPTVTNCAFTSNSTTTGAMTAGGAGMFNTSSSPTVTNCSFTANVSAGFGGGLWNESSSSPTLTNCSFTANSAIGGGGMGGNNSSPTVTGCAFTANAAVGGSFGLGGGMFIGPGSTTVDNCTFAANTASQFGGGITTYQAAATVTVTNSTFFGNTAGQGGGGIVNSSALATVTNCILWGDTAPIGPEAYDGSATLTITYSDVQGGYAGTGNIQGDPRFVDAPGDLRLLADSPCIDHGINSAAPATDQDGRARIVDGDASGTATVDMGAFEYQCGTADGPTCADIKLARPAAPSGVYWISPGGGCPFRAYCDMTTDGGGWTIVTAITGANGEEPLVSDVKRHGNPLLFGHYNVTRATKMALSALAHESIFVRSNGRWLAADRPLFDANLDTASQHTDIPVGLRTSNGTTASGYMGYSNYNITGGGDYYVGPAPADHHLTLYHHLNSGCAGQHLYSYSVTATDGDAGYDVNLALGDWAVTNACQAEEGGALVFYAALR